MAAAPARARADYDFLIKLLLIGDSGKSLISGSWIELSYLFMLFVWLLRKRGKGKRDLFVHFFFFFFGVIRFTIVWGLRMNYICTQLSLRNFLARFKWVFVTLKNKFGNYFFFKFLGHQLLERFIIVATYMGFNLGASALEKMFSECNFVVSITSYS